MSFVVLVPGCARDVAAGRAGAVGELAVQEHELRPVKLQTVVGSHLTGFRQALTRTINNYANEYKLLKEAKGGLSGEDLREGLSAVVSVAAGSAVAPASTASLASTASAGSASQRASTQTLRISQENGFTWLLLALLYYVCRGAPGRVGGTF